MAFKRNKNGSTAYSTKGKLKIPTHPKTVAAFTSSKRPPTLLDTGSDGVYPLKPDGGVDWNAYAAEIAEGKTFRSGKSDRESS